MPVLQTTFVAITCLIALIIALRVLWPRLHSTARRLLVTLFALLLVFIVLSFVSRWDTTSLRVNASLIWVRILAYEVCIVFFTLLRPRALTIAIATILTLPLLASSVVGPASSLFSSAITSRQSLGGGYFLELLPWSTGQTSGSDFTLFYQPPRLHLLRRPFMGYRLYDTQCRTADTTAAVDPHTAHLVVHCPPLSADPAAPPSGVDLDYLIPRGARSPALAPIHSR